MNQIQIASQFYDAHESLKFFLKDEFTKINLPFQEMIKKKMVQHKLTIMKAALSMLKEIDTIVPDPDDQAVAQLQILAATVELFNKEGKK